VLLQVRFYPDRRPTSEQRIERDGITGPFSRHAERAAGGGLSSFGGFADNKVVQVKASHQAVAQLLIWSMVRRLCAAGAGLAAGSHMIDAVGLSCGAPANFQAADADASIAFHAAADRQRFSG